MINDFTKELEKMNEHNKESFSFSLSNGYTIDIFKASPKEKSYGLYVCEPNTNMFYKVGRISDVQSFRKALGFK